MNADADGNLAAAERACWVVASSNADFDRLYCANLIDGDLSTGWRSFQESLEEWVELCWDFPMAVNRVRVFPDGGNRTSSVELRAWCDDAWRTVDSRSSGGRAIDGPIDFTFETVKARRLRLVMRNEAPRTTGLREVQAFGPPQPVLTLDNDGGRWTYVPVSRLPALRVFFEARDAGQPIPRYSGEAQSVTVEGVRLEPPDPAPGSDVRIALDVRPEQKLADDYVLVLTVGEREDFWHRQDWSVAREILTPATAPSHWRVGRAETIEGRVHIPVYAPHGALDVMLHSASPAGRPPLRILDRDNAEVDDGRIARVDIGRFGSDPVPDENRHAARISTANGGTVIEIDGRKVPPILFALQTPSYERYHYYSQQAGVKLYHLQIYPYRIDVGDYQRRNYAFVGSHVRNLLRVDPEAFAIIQMDMRSSAAWQEANPDGCLYTHDGRRMHESFASREYCEEARSYVGNLVRYVQSQPWGNRVIGYLIEIGEPEGVLSGAPDVGDYNPQAIEAFRDFLRNRYGNDIQRLRAACSEPQLAFEAVFPSYEKVVAAGADDGCFLDPHTQRLAIDYHAFISSLVPELLMELGGIVKGLTDGRALVGSYWAYMVEDITHGQISHQCSHAYLPHVLASPALDFFASPFNYWHPARHAGEPYLTFQPHDALRVNGKLHIPECDHRTFRCAQRDRGRNRSREETLSLIRRDLGTALMHGMGAWFSDWTNNDSKDRSASEPFFTDDQILDEIAALRGAYEGSLDRQRRTDAEAAVFVSGTSYYFHDGNAEPIYRDIVCETLYYNMNRIGAPYDQLILEDIQKPEVQEGYRCYLFINAFYLTESQRAVIEGLKRDGKTLVWVYAPGYVRDTGLSLASIEEVTGFQVAVAHEKQTLSCRPLLEAHPLTQGLADRLYGGLGGEVSPRFTIAEPSPGVVVLGRYPDGKAALAVRDAGTHKSVYSAVPYLPTGLIRNVLRFAGCHVYVDEDIVMDASNGILMLTNTFERRRDLLVRLPQRCDVLDLLTNQPVARQTDRFQAALPPGETALFRLR